MVPEFAFSFVAFPAMGLDLVVIVAALLANSYDKLLGVFFVFPSTSSFFATSLL